MKGNRTALIIAIVVVVGIGYLIYRFSTAPARYDWGEYYRAEKNQPFDVGLFRKTVETYFADRDFHVLTGLSVDTGFVGDHPALLIDVGNRTPTDSAEIDRFLRFIARGNAAFISTNDPSSILRQLPGDCGGNPGEITRIVQADSAYVFTDAAQEPIAINYAVQNQTVRNDWAILKPEACPRLGAHPIGGIRLANVDYFNYVVIPYGEGRIFLHTTPLVFANYHFRREAVLEHVENLLRPLPGGTVYYLTPGPPPTAPSTNNQPSFSEGPIHLILSHPPLRWAWYGTLVLALLFVLNGIRRDRRAIPVYRLPENETMRHLEVVCRMYRQEKNHKHIVAVQYDLLKTFLRNRYRLNVDRSDEFYHQAPQRLEMEESYLRRFFKSIHAASHLSGMSDGKLKEIDQRITEFYRKCP